MSFFHFLLIIRLQESFRKILEYFLLMILYIINICSKFNFIYLFLLFSKVIKMYYDIVYILLSEKWERANEEE